MEPRTPRMSSRPTWVPRERAALLRKPSHMEGGCLVVERGGSELDAVGGPLAGEFAADGSTTLVISVGVRACVS